MNDENPRQIAARVLRQRESGQEFTENLLENALAASAAIADVVRSARQQLPPIATENGESERTTEYELPTNGAAELIR